MVLNNSFKTLHGATLSGDLVLRGPHGIRFDATAGLEASNGIGLASWNAALSTVDIHCGNNVILQSGQELHIVIKALSDLEDGDVVYQVGTVGNSGVMTVDKFIADGSIDELYLLGVATEVIATNGFGRITTFGNINQIATDTSRWGEVWQDNDILYASHLTAGALTSAAPTSPNLRIPVAKVIHAHSSGQIFVRPVPGEHIGELHDVTVSNVTDNDFFFYDAALGTWNNASLDTIITDIGGLEYTGGLTVSDGLTAQNLVLSGAEYNGHIRFIGNNSPESDIKLEVLGNGDISFTGDNGSLFSVSDSLTGTLMSVNDIAGLPILEVFDNSSIVMGEYGTNTLVVSSDKIGILTNNPLYALDVNGTANFTETVTISSNVLIHDETTINAQLSVDGSLYVTGTNATGGNGFIALFMEPGITPESSTVVGTAADRSVMVQGNGGAFYLGRDVTNNIEFAMGTSSLGEAFAGSTSNHDFSLRVNNNDEFTITTSGDFGFGVNPPQAFAHFSDTTSIVFDLDDVDGTSRIGTYGSENLAFVTNRSTPSGSTRFTIASSNNGEALRITGENRVGIGTTTPLSTLDVTGTVHLSSNIGDTTLAISRTAGKPSIKATASNNGWMIIDSDGNTTANGVSLNHYSDDNVFLGYGGGTVGINTLTPSSSYKLDVNGDTNITGAFTAVTKSFLINHPTKKGKKLQYACLEGPENGVYVRGKSKSCIIELPDYWIGLIDEDSITVDFTPIGRYQKLYVVETTAELIQVGGVNGEYYYHIYATRKDVNKLQVEI